MTLDKTKEIISITSEDGTVYEFYKPEGIYGGIELLSVVDGYIVGWTKDDVGLMVEARTWGLQGYCFQDDAYSLTPAKKEWYEHPENFPKLIYLREEGHERDIMRPELLIDRDDYEFYCEGTVKKFEWRFATKEEVLSLYYERKD